MGFWGSLRQSVVTTMLGGFAVVLPLVLLIIVTRLIFQFVMGFVSPLTNLLGFSDSSHKLWINLLVLAAILVLFFLIGLAVRTRVGKLLLGQFENRWLKPLPLYGVLRDTVRHLFSKDKIPFSNVVLVDPFGTGVWMTGFITDNLSDGYYTVFVPTAPNPTNGFIFHVSQERLRLAGVGSEDALRSVIGLGIGSAKLFSQVVNRVAQDTATEEGYA